MRRPRPSWRHATAAVLVLLPAVALLQPVLLHSRPGITANGDASGPGGSGGSSGGTSMAGDVHELCQPLSEMGAVVAGVAVNNAVLLTVFNSAVLDFARNWLHHAVRGPAGIRNIVVGTPDAAAARLALEFGVPCVDLQPYLRNGSTAEAQEEASNGEQHEENYDWGSAAWQRMGWADTVVLLAAMRDGNASVAWSDVDLVLFRDPMPLLAEHPEADLIMATDHLGTSLAPGNTGFEQPEFAFVHQYNSGLMLVRRNERTEDLLEDWQAQQYAGHDLHEQDALNKVLLRPGIEEGNVAPHIPEEAPRTLLVANGSLRLGAMPVSSFMTGRTYNIQRLHEVKGLEPYSAHPTWTPSGARTAKIARLREAGLWHDGPEADYAVDGRYLAIDIVWPQVPWDPDELPFGEWTNRSWAMEAYALAAMDFQLSQVYYGIQLALALQRTLILPKMVCFCDNNWWGNTDCRSTPTIEEGGSPDDFPLPFVCPVDLVFEVDNFLDDPERLGPPLPHRYHNFLSTPGLPSAVLERQALIQTSPERRCSEPGCHTAARPCEAAPRLTAGTGAPQSHRALPAHCVPRQLTDGQLQHALAPLAHERVLHFADAAMLWGGFARPEDQDAADQRAQHLPVKWVYRTVNLPGRGDSEDYFIRPFADVSLLSAIVNGSMPITEVLKHRPVGKWIIDPLDPSYSFLFSGSSNAPEL